MTFPMPFVPPMALPPVVYSARINTNDPNGYGEYGYNGAAVYPTGLQAGDLLIGYTWAGDTRTFRTASGFTLLHEVNDGSAHTSISYRIADGTESGSTGGLITSFSSPSIEVIEALRFDRAVTAINDLGIGVGNTTFAKPSDETIATATNGVPPVLALAAFGSTGNMTNSDIKYPISSLWGSPDYGVNGPEVKTRGWFLGAGDTATDFVIGFNVDPGAENTLIGVAIEVR